MTCALLVLILLSITCYVYISKEENYILELENLDLGLH